MEQETQATESKDATTLLSPQREIDLLIASIEESSKHTRNVLYALLLASLYIILSALSGRDLREIELPILKVTVTAQEFLATGPLIILALHLYLHIYIADLQRRLAAFDRLELNLRYTPDKRMLLFPWFTTLALAASPSRKGSEARSANNVYSSIPSAYILLITILLLWTSAPLVLFALWMRFVGQQLAISLIPCLAIVLAMYGSSGGVMRTKLAAILGAAGATVLLTITVASVPQLRTFLPTERIWVAISAAVSHAESNLPSAFSVLSSTFLIALIAGRLATIFLYKEEYKIINYIEDLWLRLEYRSQGSPIGFVSRILLLIIESKSPLVSVIILLVMFIGFLISFAILLRG